MRWKGTAMLCLAAGLAACTGLPGVRPSVDGVEPRIESLDVDGLDVAFDVRVSNPLLSSLHVPHFAWDLDIQGRTLASGRQGLRAEFPAAGAGTVTIPVRVTYRELGAVLGDLSGRSEAEYRLSGTFKVPVFGSVLDLPFEHAGTLPIVRPPRVEITGLDTSGLSPLGGQVRVHARVTNPNPFPLDVDALGYVLGIGADDVASLQADAAAPLGPGTAQAVELTGSVSATQALAALLSGAAKVRLAPTGAVATPYGELRLP